MSKPKKWTLSRWTDCQPHVGHENILIHYIMEPKGMQTEEKAILLGRWRLTRHSLQPGKKGNFHTHPDGTSEHVFYVTSGHGQLKLDDDLQDIRTGDAVHVPPGVGHQSINNGNEWLDLLVISSTTRRHPDEESFS